MFERLDLLGQVLALLDQRGPLLRRRLGYQFRVRVAFGLHGLHALLEVHQFPVNSQQFINVDGDALDLHGVLHGPGVLADELHVQHQSVSTVRGTRMWPSGMRSGARAVTVLTGNTPPGTSSRRTFTRFTGRCISCTPSVFTSFSCSK